MFAAELKNSISYDFSLGFHVDDQLLELIEPAQFQTVQIISSRDKTRRLQVELELIYIWYIVQPAYRLARKVIIPIHEPLDLRKIHAALKSKEISITLTFINN